MQPDTAPHQHFTVSSTAYLRNLDAEDLRGECIAVHYQDAPKRTERGTSIGLKFPFLILAHYVEGQRQEAEKVARILNAHWSEAPNDTAFYRAECERLAEALEKAFPLAAKLANFAHFNEEWGRVAVGQTDVARELKAVLSDALASHTVRLIDGEAK